MRIESTETMRSVDREATLVVLPTLRAGIMPDGGVVLPRKFVDGMRKYRDYWDGPVAAIIEPGDTRSTNLDDAEFDPASLPFGLRVASYDGPEFGQYLAGHRLVLGGVSHRQNHLATLCRSVGVPCVYVAEYTLKTRFQVVRAGVRNPVISLRRHWWEYNQERRQRAGIRRAAGIQCNGTPTFEAYRSINPSPLLYLDTRVTKDMLITEDDLAVRARAVERGDPLRLIFSGRLAPMKGADHLVHVAAELRRLGVPFEMTICGGGELEPGIRADIERLGLGDRVKLAGILDFKNELVPLNKRESDLFICCHRTGDPSCTYLEVMSCGVPVVGYDNEAFQGIVRESGVGWLEPMDRPERVAARIAALSRDRAELLDASRRAAEFGARHTFEHTFRTRIEHMKSCSAGALLAGSRPMLKTLREAVKRIPAPSRLT